MAAHAYPAKLDSQSGGSPNLGAPWPRSKFIGEAHKWSAASLVVDDFVADAPRCGRVTGPEPKIPQRRKRQPLAGCRLVLRD